MRGLRLGFKGLKHENPNGPEHSHARRAHDLNLGGGSGLQQRCWICIGMRCVNLWLQVHWSGYLRLPIVCVCIYIYICRWIDRYRTFLVLPGLESLKLALGSLASPKQVLGRSNVCSWSAAGRWFEICSSELCLKKCTLNPNPETLNPKPLDPKP